MALRFIQDPSGPAGMGRVVDEASGLDRMVYDPDLAEQLSAGGAPTPEQREVIDNAQPFAPEPADPAATEPPVDQVPSVPTVPGARPQAPGGLDMLKSAAKTGAFGPGVAAGVNVFDGGGGEALGLPAPGQSPLSYAEQGLAPNAPAGTVLSKAKIAPGTPGIPYDILDEERRGEELLDKTIELQRRADAVDLVKGEQQILLERQRAESERRAREQQALATRYQKELDEVSASKLGEDKGFGNSLLGIVGMVLGAIGTSESPFGRFGGMLERRTEREIQNQRETRNSTIANLTRKLGSAQQAENHFRAQSYASAANLLENRLQRLGVQNEYGDQIQGLRDQAMQFNEAARAASFGKPGAATFEFERPEPVATGSGAPKVELNNETTQRINALGITTAAWTKGLDHKVKAGENSPTIAQASVMIKQIDRDIAHFDALAAENGGTIPNTGVVRIPESLVPWAARLGLKDGMKAEEAGQLIGAHATKFARSLGGAVTESDLEAARKVIGQSTGAIRRYLRGWRYELNDQTRATLGQVFPGKEQKAFEILLGRTAATSGVPEAKAKPFGKRNAPEPERPPEPRMSDAEKRQAENRRQLRERVGSFFEESPVRAPRFGGAK